MLLNIALAAVIFGVFAMSYGDGMWSNTIKLFNITVAGLVATSYFEPAEATDVAGQRTYPLIDGGVYAVNPSMCAYADVVRDARLPELELMLSLGTGAHTRSQHAATEQPAMAAASLMSKLLRCAAPSRPM